MAGRNHKNKNDIRNEFPGKLIAGRPIFIFVEIFPNQ